MLWCYDRQNIAERKIFDQVYCTVDRPIIITDLNEKIIAVNTSWVNMCKFTAEEAFGNTPKLLQGELTNVESALNFSMTIRGGLTSIASIVNYKKDGSKFLNNIIGWHLGDILIAETMSELPIIGDDIIFDC
jgi:PAS domain S-box-containing protein